MRELARRAQRRSLESTTAYFSQLATDLHGSLAYVASTNTSGIIWDATHIVTGPVSDAGHAGAVTVRTVSGERDGQATLTRQLPLSTVAITDGLSTQTARRAVSPPQTGDWVIAVWQTDRTQAFAAGNFWQVSTTTCGKAPVNALMSSVSLSPSMIGGGLFNMDRELLGVILPCDDRVAAVEPHSVDEMLTRAATVEERLLGLYGVLFSSFSVEERRYFTEGDGLLVREVWSGTRGEAAGLTPGDVIVALNGQAVSSVDALQPLTTPSDVPFALQVRRGPRIETVTLGSGSPEPVSIDNAPTAGLILESPVPRYRVDLVLPDSPAARAGLEPGDQLLRINRVEPRSRAQAERAITHSTSPILLEVQRDGRRVAIVIPAGAVR